jgi:FeS assembly protein IscX
MKWTWRDTAELARDLARLYPEKDPLTVTVAEIKRLVTALPTFGDDPDAGTTDFLVAIQEAWYEEVME